MASKSNEGMTEADERQGAVKAGEDWYYALPIGVRTDVMRAALDAYSVAWVSSKHTRGDHEKALRAALAAAAPFLKDDHQPVDELEQANGRKSEIADERNEYYNTLLDERESHAKEVARLRAAIKLLKR